MAPGNPSAAHSMHKRKLVSAMYFAPLAVIFLLTLNTIYERKPHSKQNPASIKSQNIRHDTTDTLQINDCRICACAPPPSLSSCILDVGALVNATL
jgi:hypothetical protein